MSELERLRTALSDITPRCYRTLRYLDDINDFPSICIFRNNEDYTHVETSAIDGFINISIRGYVRGEDSLGLADQLAEDIENRLLQPLEEFQSQGPADGDYIRVLEVSTDEGLFEPYGIVDLIISMRRRHEV